jgi:pimeloyl-ACP methyl ester carboxylesterase
MTGDTATWLFLHGTPLTPEVWAPVTERVGRSTGARTRVPAITPLPGAGPVNAALVASVLAQLDAGEAVHVVGHSFGGQIALDLAAAAPARIRSLTLLCTRDTPFPPFAAAAERLRKQGVPAPDGALARWFTDEERRADGPVVRYAARVLADADPESWALALDSIAEYTGPSAPPPPPNVPVSIVAAQLDTVSTPDAMRDMAGRIPGSRFSVAPGAAHMSLFTDPDALARRVLESA